MLKHIAQSQAKLDFGNQPKIGQIQVATETEFPVIVYGFEQDLLAFSPAGIQPQAEPAHQVRSEIIAASSPVTNAQRNHYVVGTNGGGNNFGAGLVRYQSQVFGSEMYGGA